MVPFETCVTHDPKAWPFSFFIWALFLAFNWHTLLVLNSLLLSHWPYLQGKGSTLVLLMHLNRLGLSPPRVVLLLQSPFWKSSCFSECNWRKRFCFLELIYRKNLKLHSFSFPFPSLLWFIFFEIFQQIQIQSMDLGLKILKLAYWSRRGSNFPDFLITCALSVISLHLI